MSSGLPHGWAGIPLAKLTQPTRPRRNPSEHPRLPFVGMEQVESHTRRLLGTLPASEMKSTAFHFQAGDVLYGRLRPYLNKVLCPDFEGLCSSEFIVLPSQPSFDPRYLAFYLSTDDFVEFANQLNQGDRPRVNFEQIAEHQIPVAPLNEQRRIVAKLENLLRQVDACQQRLATIPVVLKRLRQSVLAAACSGRLTADWREANPLNTADSVENLIEVCIAERRARLGQRAGSPMLPKSYELPSLPSGWSWQPLGGVTLRISDVDHRMPKARDSGLPYVSTRDFTRSEIDFGTAKLISQHDFEQLSRKIAPEKGDILISRYGTVGEVRVVTTSRRFQVSYSIAIVKPCKNVDLGRWLSLTLTSPIPQEFIRQHIQASSQPDVGLQDIRVTPVPMPPLAEQQEIIRRVEALFALAAEIDTRYEKAKTHMDNLTQSMLGKAFRGELVPTEAELARREGRDYESAQALLERITANGAAPVRVRKRHR